MNDPQEQEGATKGPLPDVTRLEEARKAKLAAADRAEDFLREPVDSSFVAKAKTAHCRSRPGVVAESDEGIHHTHTHTQFRLRTDLKPRSPGCGT